jgi:alkanesulfonate monooxygenase SsuD/methylene tetrahydromethanopterin reductase-like flavin-dependent oxidoreductase (luciferase family)
MKLGIYLNAQHPAGDDPAHRFADTLEQVRLIRSLGFDSLWSGEHHATPGFHFFPLLPMLQRLSAEADGMWIGTNLVLLPLHNPIELAEVGAFLDVITGGRFLLGVGLGYRPEEFQIFGVPIGERVSRLTEGVEIIRRLWTEDRVTHRGRHWQFENVTIRPRPLQRPRPPILVGAQVGPGITRAARIGDGWLVASIVTVDEFAAQARAFTAERAAAGLPADAPICRLLEVYCAPDEETAIRKAAPFLLEKFASYRSWGLPEMDVDPRATGHSNDPTGHSDDPAGGEQFRRLARNRLAVGSPAQVVDALVAQHRAGVTHATMRVGWPGMAQKDVLAGIELLGREVLPEVRRRTSAKV